MTIGSKIVPDGKREQRVRRKKKLSPRNSLTTNFLDMYKLTGDVLGQGSTGKVETCVNIMTGVEYAVKMVLKVPGVFQRSKLLQEIELYHLCQGRDNIIQLVEFFDEADCFYLVFEKMSGGTLLHHLQRRGRLEEHQVKGVIRDLAKAISHLHSLGVAHRDIKPDNVLCVNKTSSTPVKLCDFDLCSSLPKSTDDTRGPPLMLSALGTSEYMAPEVVRLFLLDEYDDEYDDEDPMSVSYSVSCDLWSLGVLLYILLVGSPPFSGSCDSMSCGWDSGSSCPSCLRALFHSIQTSPLSLPISLSAEARDLLPLLINRDPTQRITATDLLKHPWLQPEVEEEEEEEVTHNQLPRVSSIAPDHLECPSSTSRMGWSPPQDMRRRLQKHQEMFSREPELAMRERA